MNDNDRITELLITFGHLTEAKKAGHRVEHEMNRVISAIMRELNLNEENDRK